MDLRTSLLELAIIGFGLRSCRKYIVNITILNNQSHSATTEGPHNRGGVVGLLNPRTRQIVSTAVAFLR